MWYIIFIFNQFYSSKKKSRFVSGDFLRVGGFEDEEFSSNVVKSGERAFLNGRSGAIFLWKIPGDHNTNAQSQSQGKGDLSVASPGSWGFFFWGPSRDPLTMLPSNQEQLGTSNFLWGSSEKCICSDNVTSIPPLSGRTWRVFRDFCWKHPIFTKMTWLTPFRWKSPISRRDETSDSLSHKNPMFPKKKSPKPSWMPQRSWTQDFVWQEKNGILVRLSSRVSGETQHKNTARCFRCAKLDFLNIHIMLECVVLSKLRLRHLISSAYLGCFTNLYCAFKSCIFWGGRSLPGGSFQRFHVGKCGASIFGKEVTVENRNPGA